MLRRPVPSPSRPGRARRAGFTLIELLVVTVIVGILVALLIPAITGAIRTARNATVTGDIQTLSQALASFKEQYGDYPPSRIMLSENGRYEISTTANAAAGNRVDSANDATLGTDMTYAKLAQRSLYYLRKFFPRASLSTSGFVWTTNAQWYDFNGNGIFDNDTDATDGFYGVILEGDECLAFFLGGIPLNSSGSPGDPKWSMSGFGKLPTNPFSNNFANGNPPTTPHNLMYSPNRIPARFEFKNERLRDLDLDGFPSYLDSLATDRPFAYFSSYGMDGYDPNDVNIAESDDSVTPAVPAIMRRFRVSFPAVDASKAESNVAVSAAPNPYSVANSTTTTSWQKAQTYQIISAGRDGLWGPGGAYTADATEHLPLGNAADLNSTDPVIRSRERDNLTNFAGGPLD